MPFIAPGVQKKRFAPPACVRVATIETDEHGSVDPTQMHSTWHPLLQDAELMPQY
jgi:hypothetical protein